jgi:hypothetical protein
MKTTITSYERELLDLVAVQAGHAQQILAQTKAAMAHILLVDAAADELADDFLDDHVFNGRLSMAELLETLEVTVEDPVAENQA